MSSPIAPENSNQVAGPTMGVANLLPLPLLSPDLNWKPNGGGSYAAALWVQLTQGDSGSPPLFDFYYGPNAQAAPPKTKPSFLDAVAAGIVPRTAQGLYTLTLSYGDGFAVLQKRVGDAVAIPFWTWYQRQITGNPTATASGASPTVPPKVVLAGAQLLEMGDPVTKGPAYVGYYNEHAGYQEVSPGFIATDAKGGAIGSALDSGEIEAIRGVIAYRTANIMDRGPTQYGPWQPLARIYGVRAIYGGTADMLSNKSPGWSEALTTALSLPTPPMPDLATRSILSSRAHILADEAAVLAIVKTAAPTLVAPTAWGGTFYKDTILAPKQSVYANPTGLVDVPIRPVSSLPTVGPQGVTTVPALTVRLDTPAAQETNTATAGTSSPVLSLAGKIVLGVIISVIAALVLHKLSKGSN